MKFAKYLLLLPFVFTFAACDILENGLSDEEIVAGLKEALQIGADNSVVAANVEDGYFGNPLIKIPFPQDLQFVANAVGSFTVLGQPVGQTAVDAFVLKLNRAAENAADKAGPIFLNAITDITIVDGINILRGEDDAATRYLETNTKSDLHTAFKPDIQQALDDVGAQNAWDDVTTIYNTVTGSTVNTDLADYTTGKGLDGLFTLVAGEEKLIRDDPAARVTDLLKKVFAEQDD